MNNPKAFREAETGAACDAMVVAGGAGVAVAGKGCADVRFDAETTAVVDVTVGVPPVDAMAVPGELCVIVGLADRVAAVVAEDSARLGVAELEVGDVGRLEWEGVGDGFGVGVVVGFELVDGDDVGLGAAATGVAHPTIG